MSQRKHTILMVDDVPGNLDLLVGILGPEFRVKVANNGARALQIASSIPPPDIILLDVMMPEMDGFEVCRRLREDERTRDIPVIFVSAKGEVADEEAGLKAGAVDYITKPVRPSIVLARVKTHLALHEARRKIALFSSQLAHYVSPQIQQSILDGQLDTRLETRRRKLTIFFSDIVGFTSISEALDPEDLTYLLNAYLGAMAPIALAHGGTLDKFMGDSMLVFFGDPQSRGETEDALACVRMALEMRSAIARLHEESAGHGIRTPLLARMGISTGYCAVGNFGCEERMDYTIIGRHANLAARLESQCEPGGILISKETWLLVNAEVECRPKGSVYAKGFHEPIEVFDVEGMRRPDGSAGKVSARCDGFSLEIDPQCISSDNIPAVEDALREALACLGEGE